jgi:hypothetical protein
MFSGRVDSTDYPDIEMISNLVRKFLPRCLSLSALTASSRQAGAVEGLGGVRGGKNAIKF